jgi:hypothetical protein
MITNTGAAWIREMMRIEAEGNREFDLMIHVFRALDPPGAREGGAVVKAMTDRYERVRDALAQENRNDRRG